MKQQERTIDKAAVEEVEKFWRHLFGGQHGSLQVWTGVRDESGDIPPATIRGQYFHYPLSAQSAAEWALQKSKEGREVYYCAHLLTKAQRIKENAAKVRTLWADLDEGKIPGSPLWPTAVVETSPGRFHCFWRLTAPIPPEAAEELNLRLAHHIGADTSGFDLSQLLRVPGTTNHKYPEKPTVQIASLDGSEERSLAIFEETLPKLEENRNGQGGGDPPVEETISDEPPVVLRPQDMKVWRGEEPKLKDNGEVDRSTTLLKIGRVLYDAGANRPVVVQGLTERDVVLGYHKYTSNRDGGQGEYKRIFEKLQKEGRNNNGGGIQFPSDSSDSSTLICASSVTPEVVTWLWDRRIPKGKLTIFDGDPDMGKSVVTMDIAARVSRGRNFPDGAKCDVGNVIIVNVEDGVADTIVPRLTAAGADLDRIFILPGIPDGKGGTRLLDLPGDVPILEALINQHEAVLLIIDPVLTMLAGDANKDQDARKALTPVRDMAERTDCAVAAVRHLNKAVNLKAIQRGGGNMGLIGVARAGSFFAKHPEDDTLRVMAPHKSNLAKKPPALAYRIVTAAFYDTARIEWAGTVAHDADALAAAATTTPDEKSQLAEALEFLRDELGDGPMWAKQVFKDARDAGVSDITLKRAKASLCVRSEKIGMEGWQWELPTKEGDHSPGDDTVDPLDPLQNSYSTGGENSPYIKEGYQGDQGDQGDQGGQDDPDHDPLPMEDDPLPVEDDHVDSGVGDDPDGPVRF